MTTVTEPRGARLLDAVLAVTATDGYTSVSMRSVAARAGVSVAQVQYYFHTKAELVAAAFDHANSGFLDSLATLLPEDATAARLRDIVWAWIPLDAEREDRARVWLAYSAMAATDDRLARAAAQLDTDLRTWFTEQLSELQRTGQIRSDLDPANTATQLLALIDGVTVHCLVLPRRHRALQAESALGAWLHDLAPSST